MIRTPHRGLIALLLLTVASVPAHGQAHAAPPRAALPVQSERGVTLVEPTPADIDSMKARDGDDFYTIADDAVYAVADGRALLDSLGIPFHETERRPLGFRVQGRTVRCAWKDVDLAWFFVAYDGVHAPRVYEPSELYQAIPFLTAAKPSGGASGNAAEKGSDAAFIAPACTACAAKGARCS